MKRDQAQKVQLFLKVDYNFPPLILKSACVDQVCLGLLIYAKGKLEHGLPKILLYSLPLNGKFYSGIKNHA